MYVRTKDGIYEVDYSDYFQKWYDVKTGKTFVLDNIFSKEQCRLADTIEELCDEFHIEYFSLDNKLCYVRFYDFEIAKQNNEDNDEIYGVIHIKGKGLIYVAKMNDKGELELL